MDLAPDFNEFCALLSARSVEFVIVGAHALAFHGAPRFTGDLDILVRPTEENGRRVLAAIADFGFPTAPLTPSDIVAGKKVVTSVVHSSPIDPAEAHALRDVLSAFGILTVGGTTYE